MAMSNLSKWFNEKWHFFRLKDICASILRTLNKVVAYFHHLYFISSPNQARPTSYFGKILTNIHDQFISFQFSLLKCYACKYLSNSSIPLPSCSPIYKCTPPVHQYTSVLLLFTNIQVYPSCSPIYKYPLLLANIQVYPSPSTIYKYTPILRQYTSIPLLFANIKVHPSPSPI